MSVFPTRFGSWRLYAVAYVSLVTTLACNDSTSPNLEADPRWALAWANDPDDAEYEVDTDYTFSTDTSGRTISITRASAGTYAVRFPYMASRGWWKETIHVSAYGTTPRRCRIASWSNDTTDLIAQVRCHDLDGVAADSRFTILLASPGTLEGRGAFMVSTSNSGGVVSSSRSYNPRGRTITVERDAAGTYLVTFRGLSRNAVVGSGNEVIHVTTYGGGTAWCKVGEWGSSDNDLEISVLCFTPDGDPADAQFSVLILERARTGESGDHRLGYLWLSDHTVAGLSTIDASYSFNSSGGLNTGNRTGTGVYVLGWVGLPNVSQAETNLVTAYGNTDSYCQVSSWGSSTTTIRCFAPNGAAVNSQFTAIWVE